MKKLLVIDGNSIINRAFYGVRPLTNGEGLPTNALFGMLNILLKQMETVAPDYAAIAYDLHAPTFRHEKFPDYKAGRKPSPDELRLQMPHSKEMSEALGIHVISNEGYEADDLLGTCARMASERGVYTYILTGDKDSLQLISEDVSVLLATNADTVEYNKEKFFDSYGIAPDAFLDVKALMGDSSDNIPGVPGIGEKTALKLISEYGSLDEIYRNIDSPELGKSVKDKLANGKDSAYLSKWLAAINKNVPVNFTLDELSYNGIDNNRLFEIFTTLGFKNHIKRLNLTSGKSGAMTDIDIKNSTLEYFDSLSEKDYSIVIEDDEAAVFDGDQCTLIKFDDLNLVAEKICASKAEFIVYDSKLYHRRFLDCGFRFENCAGDVMLAAYVLNSASKGYELESLVNICFGENLGDGIARKAEAVYRLNEYLTKRLAESNQYELYIKIELPLAGVLAGMEKAGFALDTKGLTDFSSKLSEMENQYAERIYMLSGEDFNINSPKQLGEVLFGKLKIPAGKKTKTGYSTNAEILEKLRHFYPIVDDILEYRSVAKLRSTYTDALVNVADKDGRVHTSFNQTITVTGRLSSTEPNLQNIPVRTQLGREMRKFFVAGGADYVLIDADYSQIELRILAHIAGDKTMIDAFINGLDIHTVTASQVFGVSSEDVTFEMRKRAKAVNFGIVYGIGDFSLAADIGVTKKQAGEYIKNYFEKYSAISDYLKNIVQTAADKGYVETVFGRRRYIPELKSAKAQMRAFGERVAMNSPIQGSSADIIKLAMINCDKALRAEKLDAKLILQVHDELIVEAHKDCSARASEILKNEMENVVKLSVPLEVDLKIGDTWFDCKD